MSDLLAVLRERGFLYQTTDAGPLEEALASGRRLSAYVGIDPTAASCHVGHLLPLMGLMHVQRAGHRPILLLGGGTARIGDPSGKEEMRRLLGGEEIDANARAIRRQLARYFEIAEPGAPDDGGTRAVVVDNADWLLPLDYIGFLREIGRHFSVNRMLSTESVKLRLESESGLSFLEFNYSLLQAYDFLVLWREHGCELQLGGSDQWGNIVAGIDLIRRVEGASAHGITFPLITTAGGRKMGKTEKGAVWLAAERTSPYDYYQFWVNTADEDVGRFLRLFTLLSIEEIERLERLEGAAIREAKQVLAFEATVLTHGRERAEEAREGARSLFGAGGSGDAAGVPTWEIEAAALEAGVPVFALFNDAGLCPSRGAARRMARQGGLYLWGEPVDEERVIGADDARDGAILLRAGKKRHLRVIVR